MRHSPLFFLTVSVLLVSGADLFATERTWTGSSSTDWFASGNWDPGDNYPQTDDTVTIPSGASVLLTNETAVLASFSITNATLTFSNWTTRLRATTVTVRNNGNLTHAQVDTNAAPGVTNRVWVDCTTFNLEDGGKVNVAGKGFITEQGPGAAGTCCGGGHGGIGGIRIGYAYPGDAYGSTNAPILPGSGGNGNGSVAGYGGGAVRIEAVTAEINGTINANGGNASGSYRGGGSGGSVYISCDTVEGNGTISADGGNPSVYGGAGGGGRISVAYDPVEQADVTPVPALSISANHGTAPSRVERGGYGSLYFPDGRLIPSVMVDWGGELYREDMSWSLAGLTVSNAQVAFPAGTELDISGNLVLDNGSVDFTFTTANTESLSIGGALALTNSSILYLQAAATNGASTIYGGLLNVAGENSFVASNCVIYPVSHSTDGGSIKMRFGDVTIAQGGAINANVLGYAPHLGPGAGGTSCGAGYGGRGGERSGYPNAGSIYGSTNAPAEPGSGAGGTSPSGDAGAGGGLIWIEADNVQVDGALMADGGVAPVNYSGGGSGGGIFIRCIEFEGSGTAVMSADGGLSGFGGGGGGGRIAIWDGVPDALRSQYMTGITNLVVRDTTNRFYAGTMTVNPGTGGDPEAEEGSAFFFLPRPMPGLILLVR